MPTLSVARRRANTLRQPGELGATVQPQDEQQPHRPDDGHDEVTEVPPERGPAPGEQTKEDPAEKGADDADDDVLQPALLPIRPRDHAGHPARQRPEDDPGDDAEAAFHRDPPLPL